MKTVNARHYSDETLIEFIKSLNSACTMNRAEWKKMERFKKHRSICTSCQQRVRELKGVLGVPAASPSPAPNIQIVIREEGD